MSRRADTIGERQAFLDAAHREVMGRGLEELSPDGLAVVMQTMADAAVLSDDDVRTHYERTMEMVAAGAVGTMDVYSNLEVDPHESRVALQILILVLRRELDMRGLPTQVPVRMQGRVMNGQWRARALQLALAWR